MTEGDVYAQMAGHIQGTAVMVVYRLKALGT